MKHVIGVVLVIALLTVGGLFVLTPANLLPVQASAQAVFIDQLFSYQFYVISFLFALIMGLMIYSVIVFRRKPGDMEDAQHIEGNTPLELAWTGIPLVIVVIFAIIGSNTLASVLRPDPKALEIKVTGRQWAWTFEYPEYGVSSDKLVLPVNKQALLLITSDDVLHAFWVPEFRVKQDAVPGAINQLRITPTKERKFKLMCAEICGRDHTFMVADVQVVKEEAFKEFIENSKVPTDPIARGEYWYRTQGCKACHNTDGAAGGVGPTYKGLYGSQVELEDGSLVFADELYMKESIINPNAKLVKGYGATGKSAMPGNFGNSLTPEQINEIIGWIETLK